MQRAILRKILIFLLIATSVNATETVLVETESFKDTGGWVVDTQFMDQMGSPFLLAHGLGRPVADATTEITFPSTGTYKLWLRTRDWVGQWKKSDLSAAMRAEGTPGKFQLLIDGKPVTTTFGTEGADWHWQDGGVIDIQKKNIILAIHDLTGFDGRCDAILFSTDHQLAAPNTFADMQQFRRKLLGYPDSPAKAGEYDIVVVGGGLAGACSAVSAARGGCTVALIQNRPVLGGNNSSEVRVGASGMVHQQPFNKLGDLVNEVAAISVWDKKEAELQQNSDRLKQVQEIFEKNPERKIHNAGPASNYEDQKKLDVVLAEKNISLFLNMHVNDVKMDGSRIVSVIAQDTRTGQRLEFKGRLFADCTGDGNLGYLAKADFRAGREPKSLTGESMAPKKSDNLVMGTSVQWYAKKEKKPSTFPLCPWAIQFDAKSCTKTTKGDWNWETGIGRDQIEQFEHIRDYGLRVIYGNWAFLKNNDQLRDKYAKYQLAWAAYIGGKRESRRLLGDVILTQQDIQNKKQFPDACVTTTWSIDLHYPKDPGIDIDPFRSTAKQTKIKPYAIPYRCLYSRNVDNLMMAGRNISVTHVALGTIRVMRTTGMMGEVLGMAASLCKKHACNPRDVYKKHLSEFKELLKQGVPKSSSVVNIGETRQDNNDPNVQIQSKDTQKTYRIMPIGDSITAGGKNFSVYRYPLLQKLTKAGYDVKFVGSKISDSPVGPLSHEGYGGRTTEYLAKIIGKNFKENPADIVLIHSGHNHFANQKPVPGIIAATETIIQDIRQTNPQTTVLLAQVIPSGKLPKYAYITELNESLAKLAARLNTSEQPVLLVNQAETFDWKTDTVSDKVHPNAKGAEKMANRWFQVLTQIMKKRNDYVQ